MAVGAWSLGAAAATGGSVLAVSMLGDGFTSAPSQQLTVAMVQRKLASEAAETSVPATTAPAPVPSVRLGGTATPITRRRVPATRAPAASPTPTASPRPPSPGGTVLSSAGGTIVAGCQSAGAYLESWSPQQGYEAKSVVRGPASTAQVAFKSTQQTVTMVVSCSSGVPSATTQVQGSWGGDD
jgi:hypothetical protein